MRAPNDKNEALDARVPMFEVRGTKLSLCVMEPRDEFDGAAGGSELGDRIECAEIARIRRHRDFEPKPQRGVPCTEVPDQLNLGGISDRRTARICANPEPHPHGSGVARKHRPPQWRPALLGPQDR